MIFYLGIFLLGAQPRMTLFMNMTEACKWTLAEKGRKLYGFGSDKLEASLSQFSDGRWYFDARGTGLSKETLPVPVLLRCKKTIVRPETPPPYEEITAEEAK